MFTKLRRPYFFITTNKDFPMLKKSIIAIFSLMILSSLTACNTTKGVGEDIQAGGQAIQRSAE